MTTKASKGKKKTRKVKAKKKVKIQIGLLDRLYCVICSDSKEYKFFKIVFSYMLFFSLFCTMYLSVINQFMITGAVPLGLGVAISAFISIFFTPYTLARCACAIVLLNFTFGTGTSLILFSMQLKYLGQGPFRNVWNNNIELVESLLCNSEQMFENANILAKHQHEVQVEVAEPMYNMMTDMKNDFKKMKWVKEAKEKFDQLQHKIVDKIQCAKAEKMIKNQCNQCKSESKKKKDCQKQKECNDFQYSGFNCQTGVSAIKATYHKLKRNTMVQITKEAVLSFDPQKFTQLAAHYFHSGGMIFIKAMKILDKYILMGLKILDKALIAGAVLLTSLKALTVNKYIGDIEYENHYITASFQHMDILRQVQNLTYVLPLRKHEKKSYFFLMSPSPTVFEKKKLKNSITMYIVKLILVISFLAFDRRVSDLMDNIAQKTFAEYYIRTVAGARFATSGKGKVYKTMVGRYNEIKIEYNKHDKRSNIKCLPHVYRLKQESVSSIVILLTMDMLISVTSSFVPRLEIAILNFFYRKHAKKRAKYLYNQVVFERKNFFAVMYAKVTDQIHQNILFKEKVRATPVVLLVRFISRKLPFLGFLKSIFKAPQLCLFCNEKESKKGWRCKNCTSYYCLSCIMYVEFDCFMCKWVNILRQQRFGILMDELHSNPDRYQRNE